VVDPRRQFQDLRLLHPRGHRLSPRLAAHRVTHNGVNVTGQATGHRDLQNLIPSGATMKQEAMIDTVRDTTNRRVGGPSLCESPAVGDFSAFTVSREDHIH
jgi:hypothetical protein